jgi:Putative prokaryotic signal transducing protein
MEEFVEVYAAGDITLAYLVKAHLEDAGIPVQIANENLQGAYCIDGMVPRVLVPASQAKQAQEVIAEIQKGAPDDEDDLDDPYDEEE